MSDRFEELAQAWLNGAMSDAEFGELQDMLRSSDECRERLLDFASLDAGLRDFASQATGDVWSDHPDDKPNVISFSTFGWLAAAAVVAISTFVFFFLALNKEDEMMGKGYAVLTRSVDVEWEGKSFEAGDIIPEGRIQMNSGVAQIEFFGGATLVIEGPGDLDIRSASEAFCRSGKLRASVPPAARGFVIDTPDGKVVDLGTEFGLEIGDKGAPEVHVFDGKVELHREGSVREIVDGEAVSGDSELTADRSRFVSALDLDSQVAESNSALFERWREFSRTVRRDPRVLAYFPMDQPGSWNRRLFNEATTGSEIDGAIVGANRVPGRWEDLGKSAVEFTPMGSRVRLAIPGEFESLTFMCWVRVDSLDRVYNALFLTDSYQPGESHWQIQEDGRVLFSFLHSPKNNCMSRSPVVWDISKSGQWMHLAAVLDLEKHVIRHYADGELTLEDPIGNRYRISKTRLGHGEIGNWGLPNSPEKDWFAIRNLNGRIDEFAIYADALTSDEIAEIYRVGNPH